MLERLRHRFRDVAYDASGGVDRLLHETTLRLAVTGLSRAGKTVFVTSLIANLLALGRGLDTLPRFHAQLAPGGTSRLRAVRLVPPGSGDTPVFEQARNLAILAAAAPDWPPHTDDLAEIAVEFVLDRRGLCAGFRGPRRVRLEILDYPGEWLLDLPLLEQSFEAWSAETLTRLREPPRNVACAGFLEQLPAVDPEAVPDHALIRRLHALYRDGLQACRSRFGLRLLQPGRFLCPGARADAPLMWFFPLDGAPAQPVRGTTAALLRERFEAYKADMRERFFETHFARFDRQVVLVDVLGALHAGREAFADTGRALALVAGGLSHGRKRQRTIERVAFVATKADHVPTLGRQNLCNLLRHVVEGTREPIGDRPVSFHTAAAVLATIDAVVLRDGLSRDVVRGTPLGAGAAKLFDPGNVPSGRPHEGFWNGQHFALPVFEPPRIDPADGASGIPHLGLDEVLAALLGDAL